MTDKIKNTNTNINNIKIVVPTSKPRRKYTSKTGGKGGLDGATQRLSTLQNRATSSGVQPNISVGGPTIMFPSGAGPVATTPPQVPVAPSAIIPVKKEPTFTAPKKIPMGGSEPVGGGTPAPLYDSKTADKKTTSTGSYGEIIPPKKKDRSLHPEDTERARTPRQSELEGLILDNATPNPRPRPSYVNQESVRASPRRRDTNALEGLTEQERQDFRFYPGTGTVSQVKDLRGPPARNVRVDSQGNIISAKTPLPPLRTSQTPRALSPSQRQRQSDTRLSKGKTEL